MLSANSLLSGSGDPYQRPINRTKTTPSAAPSKMNHGLDLMKMRPTRAPTEPAITSTSGVGSCARLITCNHANRVAQPNVPGRSVDEDRGDRGESRDNKRRAPQCPV